MTEIAITGAGLMLGTLRTPGVNPLITSQKPDPGSLTCDEDLMSKYSREVARKVAREDRSILNNVAVQCLLSSIDAFSMAEGRGEIDFDIRENIAVFSSAEREREFPVDLWDLIHNMKGETLPSVEKILSQIGLLRERVHPLALFKKLPTNALYHLSKFFQLRGGGYPLQRMSLGGICMLEEAAAKIRNKSLNGALLSAYGNMASLDNLVAFQKMGLLKDERAIDGIIPASGAASVLLEPLEQIIKRGGTPIGLVKRVCSSYHEMMHVGEQDWLEFFDRHFSDLAGKSPIIVMYDNGLKDAGKEERSAISRFFQKPITLSYKQYTGYTGQSNNLIDIVFALSDNKIPVNHPVLLNGIGSSAGMGAVLFEKQSAILPNLKRGG